MLYEVITNSSFGFFGEASNSVGGYLANALPDSSEGLNAYEMFAQPRKAYVLLGVEPELDCVNPTLAVEALKQADLVVALSTFKGDIAETYADVLLPAAPFTESSGTYVSAEGRVQSVAGVCRPAGESRPAWKILRVLVITSYSIHYTKLYDGGGDWSGSRFAVVSHLTSITHNWRVRVRCFASSNDFSSVPSVVSIWNSANWFEREAFDLFGIVFPGHSDLRRLLTDVITSYSIHYTKLYDLRRCPPVRRESAGARCR